MTVTQVPAYDARALAEELRARHLPGQRSMTAITRLRRDRQRNRRENETRQPAIEQRAAARLLARCAAEIERRGGETGIENDRDSWLHLRITDRRLADGLVVLHVRGWRYYGRNAKPRPASLSYLCGREDGGDWATRIPGTITDVADALAWLTPADVTKARQAGRLVHRQGDVYAIQTTPKRDGTGELPDRHSFDPATRVLSHPQHAPLTLPYPVRFVMQNSYGMGRGARKGCGDA